MLGYLARRTGVGAAEAEMDVLAARLGGEPELASEYADALDRFLALGGEDFEPRARAVLGDVGLGPRTEQEMATLSGGEAAKAALAALLLARFDVFLLDEPTNNLDFTGLERLERFLDSLAAGVVLVSHDRAFLDRTVTRVIEIEAETRKRPRVRGHLVRVRGCERTGARAARAGVRETTSMRRAATPPCSVIAERRRAARWRAQAGAPDGGDRRATNALRGKVQQAKNHLERLDEVEKPWSPWRLRLDLPARPAASVIAELAGAVVERGSFRLGPVSLELHWGERLAIVGPNGSGKTTLIGALLGELPLARGDRRLGPTVVFGELNQARDRFTGVLLDDFVEASGLLAADARTLLAKFALGEDDIGRPAPRLSPGERTRAGLALLAARGVNCLVLDEPTNHLDLEAIEELETALETFDGCLVVVTHDRRFLERLRVTRTISL